PAIHAASASGLGSVVTHSFRAPASPAQSNPGGRPSYRRGLDPVATGRAGGGIEPEPVKAVGTETQEVRRLPDGRKARVAEELEGSGAAMTREIQLHRLRAPGEIGDDENPLLAILTQEGEHGRVARAQELDRAPAERGRALAGGDEPPHRVEQRGGRRVLSGH